MKKGKSSRKLGIKAPKIFGKKKWPIILGVLIILLASAYVAFARLSADGKIATKKSATRKSATFTIRVAKSEEKDKDGKEVLVKGAPVRMWIYGSDGTGSPIATLNYKTNSSGIVKRKIDICSDGKSLCYKSKSLGDQNGGGVIITSYVGDTELIQTKRYILSTTVNDAVLTLHLKKDFDGKYAEVKSRAKVSVSKAAKDPVFTVKVKKSDNKNYASGVEVTAFYSPIRAPWEEKYIKEKNIKILKTKTTDKNGSVAFKRSEICTEEVTKVGGKYVDILATKDGKKIDNIVPKKIGRYVRCDTKANAAITLRLFDSYDSQYPSVKISLANKVKDAASAAKTAKADKKVAQEVAFNPKMSLGKEILVDIKIDESKIPAADNKQVKVTIERKQCFEAGAPNHKNGGCIDYKTKEYRFREYETGVINGKINPAVGQVNIPMKNVLTGKTTNRVFWYDKGNASTIIKSIKVTDMSGKIVLATKRAPGF